MWSMGYRCGIRHIDMVIYHIDMVILDTDMGDEANDMGEDSIDTVISHIDMGYLVTLPCCPCAAAGSRTAPPSRCSRQGLTLLHFSAQPEPILTQKHTLSNP
jgi:hypothetical protein